ncbi:MAG: tRNA 5-methoxyuridine(34)/uridine 5-oxyacetic acid(34) synthase CmoB [Methylomonas sp.]|jgi:tRNA (mo5U34)-methyltransferase|uniref:tRNA 5-methoxyuridine(34)/uridine 5-oxyacetic acid(34) synthase CmoB n=1 Tax=Methylomonas sp. TaxID=418 RepID=UPI00260094B2|nr:tRNA 5-methoxyuridine(34)/uridine 5-oxyacetic acid(34) synthase CmoB [Methylomonas sp.]MCK9609109.1 tRNA 5-methoxyuridine(34)/uridine 5-oxyacetic acid(34) synthase CmoB [Methylomonas sp.]
MNDYKLLYQALESLGASAWVQLLSEQLPAAFDERTHGDLLKWKAAIDELPNVKPSRVNLRDAVSIGESVDLSEQQLQQLVRGLQKLHPWRKGPYRLFGVDIDTEWRSDWKWDRLKPHIAPLQNRMVLDIGCGNGYHCWRMLGAGARLVIGIDPTLLSVMQFQALRKLYGADLPMYVLPLGVEQLPAEMRLFDTVFSMGVLYHRRSPIDHLLELKGCLRPGGELVLETLVVEGGADTVLFPESRYAQMRNVWFLPSCDLLMAWMRRCGFKNIRLCDVAKTTVEEQRSTEWMRFNSLKDFLDPQNSALTCEGLPAPRRAIVVACID